MRKYLANLAHPRAAVASLVALAVLVLVLASVPFWPSKFDVHGAIIVEGQGSSGGECVTDGGYSDISEGAGVVVKTADGKIAGAGQLDAGKTSDQSEYVCNFGFKVLDVPGGDGPYTVTVSHRGDVVFDEKHAGSVVLTLGP
jgi:hypothetical protein